MGSWMWWCFSLFFCLHVVPLISANSNKQGSYNEKTMEDIAERLVKGLESEEKEEKRDLDKKPICGGPLKAKKRVQTLSSPRDDEGEYPESIHCGWVITARKGQNVHLHFTHFDLENRKWWRLSRECNDYVEIYDGGDSNADPIGGQYCVKETPRDITSTGNQIYIKFYVDENDERTGFDIEYKSVGGSVDNGNSEDDGARDITHIEEIIDPTPEGEMPEVIGLKFLAHDQLIILRLHRNRRITADVPVYLGGPDELSLYDNPDRNMDFGLYSEVEQQAGFLMKTHKINGKLKRSYFGSFINLYLNISYILGPLLPEEACEDGDYLVRRIDRAEMVFKGDARTQSTLMTEARTQRSLHELRELLGMRSKRQQGRRQYTVEMLLFVDYAIFNQWFQLSKETDFRRKENDAIDNIRFYFSHVVNGIDLRYQSINEPDYGIAVRLVAIYIARRPEDSPYTERYPIKQQGNPRGYTHAYKALDAFEKWLNESHHKLPTFDQATLFTGNILFGGYRSDGSKRPISGLADIRGACTYYGASINVHAGLYPDMQTGAHELGHNLGSNHDGTGNSCTGRDQYIMASTPGELTDRNYKNAFTFSYCSKRAFREFLFFLQMENKNCMINRASHSGLDENALKQFPGQRFTLNEQCQKIIGFGSFYCGGGDKDGEICRKILCYNPQEDKCTSTTEQRAAEGTTCGDKKWCVQGDCVYDSRAPSGQDTCIYGDFRGKFHDGRTCSDVIREDPWQCYNAPYSQQCCASCARIQNPQAKGCEFGDKSGYCRNYKSADCYQSRVRDECCSTCARHLRKNPVTPDCIYGDKASWCSTVQSQQCYKDSDQCCETCVQLQSSDPNCKWGDSATWCRDLKQYECYVNKKQCCGKCKQVGPPGCEFGDKNRDCHGVNCNDRYYQKSCCKTCAKEAGLDPNWKPTPPPQPSPSQPNNPIPEGCKDGPTWCSTMPAMDCYVSAKFCCATCAQSRDNSRPAGCEYGDHVSWCAGHVKTVSQCDSGQNLSKVCCLTCATFKGSIQPQQPPACEDKASWCPSIHASYCYDKDTGENTCCKTCSHLKTGPNGCEYGDMATWCTRIERYQCDNQSVKKRCCYSC